MTKLSSSIGKLKVWRDTRGQDFIEYALMAGFVASIAAYIFPGVNAQIAGVFASVIVQLQRFGG